MLFKPERERIKERESVWRGRITHFSPLTVYILSREKTEKQLRFPFFPFFPTFWVTNS